MLSPRQKIALGIEYEGSSYQGWQAQKNGRGNTIQCAVEAALSAVANESVSLMCAGRTDAGVHALEQVAHFETQAVRTDRQWQLGCQSHLPADISIGWAKSVLPEFHARYSATFREYVYWISNSAVQSALLYRRSMHRVKPLQTELMHRAAQALIGTHDFSAFRSSQCQAKHGVRRLMHCAIHRRGAQIFFVLRANGFLHHMVRNIVGSLLRVGQRDRDPAWIAELLQAKCRALSGPTAPAHGLYLARVGYPDRFSLPSAGTPLSQRLVMHKWWDEQEF